MNSFPKRSLVETLTYQYDPILDRFLGEYAVTPAEATLFFNETKKWMWLCAQAYHDRKAGRIDFPLVIDSYLIFLDEMWHNFILFTKQYDSFCHTYLGTFIHHNPIIPTKSDSQHQEIDSSEVAYEKLIANRRKQYEYIYDTLGSETLTAWYGDYGLKYTKSWLEESRQSSLTL